MWTRYESVLMYSVRPTVRLDSYSYVTLCELRSLFWLVGVELFCPVRCPFLFHIAILATSLFVRATFPLDVFPTEEKFGSLGAAPIDAFLISADVSTLAAALISGTASPV